MEVENKKSVSPILIAVLVLLGSCLLGIGAWYGLNYFKDNESDKPVEEVSSKTTSVGERIDFPQKSDDSVFIGNFYKILSQKEIETDFKNLEKKVNGHTLIFNCEEYVKDEPSCAKIKLKIDDEFIYEEKVPYALGYDDIDIYKANNYYVVTIHPTEGGFEIGHIEIYKGLNMVLKKTIIYGYELEDKYSSTYVYNSNNYISVKPVIKNNTLYFVEVGNDDDWDNLKYNTIDLSKDSIEVKLVKEFHAYNPDEK